MMTSTGLERNLFFGHNEYIKSYRHGSVPNLPQASQTPENASMNIVRKMEPKKAFMKSKLDSKVEKVVQRNMVRQESVQKLIHKMQIAGRQKPRRSFFQDMRFRRGVGTLAFLGVTGY